MMLTHLKAARTMSRLLRVARNGIIVGGGKYMLTYNGQESGIETGMELQTFRRSYAEIVAGEDPWYSLGIFMHQFFGYYSHRRAELVAEPLDFPEDPTHEQMQWAVFCAASVEHLCRKYGLECPAWSLDERYMLPAPWFYGIGADRPQVQEKLRTRTSEEFTRRNIFCGDRVFSNKYEHRERLKTA